MDVMFSEYISKLNTAIMQQKQKTRSLLKSTVTPCYAWRRKLI